MCELDQSDTAVEYQNLCRGLNEPKAKLWEYFLNKEESNKQSVQRVADIMAGFNSRKHYDELLQYKDKFFECILDVFETRSKEYAKTFFTYLFPISDDLEELIKKATEVEKKAKSDILLKQIKEETDIMERRLRAYKIF